uniref:lipid IV(A) palmitoyltransferase PagP n=1 Tax=Castellaniella defragrans TaxID=75697 RepID=UPI00333FD89D
MRKSLVSIVLCLSVFLPAGARACDMQASWMQRACSRVVQIWDTGHNDLYLTGWAWHNRAMYSARKIREFNEGAWGGGYGRSIYDEDGNWQGLYFMSFLDSHARVQAMAGYGFLNIADLSPNWHVGAGYTLFLMSRKDINDYIPFPGVLPLVSVGYRKASVFATYIPGARGAGNVLFVFGKWSF